MANDSFLYALVDADGPSPIGIFDAPNMSIDQLKLYYGDDLTVIHERDIRDSGLEWEKVILVDGVACYLTLHYYTLNEFS